MREKAERLVRSVGAHLSSFPTPSPLSMERSKLARALVACLATCACHRSPGLSASIPANVSGIRSADVLEAGPPGVVFVGDSLMGTVHAVEVPRAEQKATGAFNISDVQGLMAQSLKVEPGALRIRDLAFVRESGVAVLAVNEHRSKADVPRLALIDAAGAISWIDLRSVEAPSLRLNDQPDSDLEFWGELPARAFTITDIEWHDGEIFVAGLSNAEFSSTVRRATFPFTEVSSASSISMYHAVHNQIESRSPIESLEVVSLGGEPHLLATYVCTPLVTVPLADLRDGAQVRGKTIAELGWGNTPIDLVPLDVSFGDFEERQYLLTNEQRHAMLIAHSDLEAHQRMEGISSPVPFPTASHAGVPVLQVPLGHVSHVADQSAEFLLALTHHKRSGRVELSSRRKGLFLRISEFIDEFDFPTYSFEGSSTPDFQEKYLRPTRAMLMRDEGLDQFVR